MSLEIEQPVMVKKREDGRIRYIKLVTEIDDSWYKDLAEGAIVHATAPLPEPDDDIQVDISIQKKEVN